MLRLKNPSWIDFSLLDKTSYSQFNEEIFNSINNRLQKVVSNTPTVSIIIIAYNEETNIIRCVDSLSKLNSKYPFEIIVVDNNSTDRTAEVIKKLHVNYVLQKTQGCGAARQAGLEQSKGKYILTGDADTLYPIVWVNELLRSLEKPGVVCVYGRYSFIADDDKPRWKLTLYETLSDLMVFVRGFKRPYLSALGMSMGFVREVALKIGYVEANVRGEDGRLAFDLMKYGKVKSVMSTKARVWTSTRTLNKYGGSLWDIFKNRMVIALANFGSLLKKEKDHDTRTSVNGSEDYQENLKVLKKKIGLKK